MNVLVHAVDVEGKAHGVETELAELLSGYTGRPVTCAGGVGSMKDIEDLRTYGGKPPGCNGRKRFGSLWRKYSLYRTCQIKVILQELTLYF